MKLMLPLYFTLIFRPLTASFISRPLTAWKDAQVVPARGEHLNLPMSVPCI